MATDENSTVYLLGAGVNRVIRLPSPSGDVFPPLIRTFFQEASKLDYWPGAEDQWLRSLTPEQFEEFRRKGSGPHTRGQRFKEAYQPVYDYIERNWNLSYDALASQPFDLEELFTRLQQELTDAARWGDEALAEQLAGLFLELITYLGEVLQLFWRAPGSDLFSRLARTVYHEGASVITFNYDTYLEEEMESAGGRPPFPSDDVYNAWHERYDALQNPADEDLALRDHNWVRALAYGIRFDLVQIHQFATAPMVEGRRYYGHPANELCDRQILKLHGSLNWFTYATLPNLPPEKENQTVLLDWHHSTNPYWGVHSPSVPGDYPLRPAIVTPVLHKEGYFTAPMYRNLFPPIWERAREILSKCTRLVVIGYSFASSDTRTAQLLRESFEKHELQELVVVNPHKEIAEKAKELCHFERPVIWHCDLAELLELLESRS